MSDFDSLWKSALRFRRASRELEPLVHDVYDAMHDAMSLQSALDALLAFLASESGRTDANCSVTHHFIDATESRWRDVPGELHAILDDMSGALHESIYAPHIARTFESTPEQLLERIRKLR
ncbi:MAG TPA: hypothetical protein VJZ00_05535 [Thermoanaerobaculia bacterium]|nr:hypothetical protein [Thermoanaerobaculia bacterium]